MNLAIDIGNSSVKIGSFRDGILKLPVKNVQIQELGDIVEDINPERIVVSSVAIKVDRISLPFIKSYPTLVIEHKTPLPFKLDYETPETLGVDRLAAAAGAQVINPGGTSMVIDAGTCITYDLITGENVFLGGIISPGLKLRFRSMHEFTGNLPQIDDFNIQDDMDPVFGKSTRQAMKIGVINGIKSEMESFIQAYMELFPDLRVIITGGKAKFFESKLKATIFVVPELVLIGLNRILEYNVQT